MQKQLLLIERSVRALRVEFETELASQQLLDEGLGTRLPIRSAMETLLSSGNAFPEVTPSANEPYFPGLYCGFSGKGVLKPITVRGLSLLGAASQEPMEQSTCLVARVEIGQRAPPKWISLEVAVEREDLLRTRNLVTRFNCCFRGGYNLENLGLALRLHLESEDKEYYTHSFPALDTPFEFTYNITPSQYDELPLQEASEAWFIINLPVYGRKPYDFILSHFETKGDPA